MASINRGLIWSILPELPKMFPSIIKAKRWLRSIDRGYNENIMHRDVSTAFQRDRVLELQQLVKPEALIQPDWFIEKQWNRPENYFYYGTAYFEDPLTGEQFQRTYSLYANSSMTDQELTDAAYWGDIVAGSEPERDMRIVRFERLESFHKWGTPRAGGQTYVEG